MVEVVVDMVQVRWPPSAPAACPPASRAHRALPGIPCRSMCFCRRGDRGWPRSWASKCWFWTLAEILIYRVGHFKPGAVVLTYREIHWKWYEVPKMIRKEMLSRNQCQDHGIPPIIAHHDASILASRVAPWRRPRAGEHLDGVSICSSLGAPHW